jgi:hypothetical protein
MAEAKMESAGMVVEKWDSDANSRREKIMKKGAHSAVVTAGRLKTLSSVDWRAVNWRMPSGELARQLGVRQPFISAKRRKWAPETVGLYRPEKRTIIPRARSKAQKTQLESVWASRRGVPVNDPGVSTGELRSLTAAVLATFAVRTRNALAKHCGVDQRTVRRWLNGTRTPPANAVISLRQWLDICDGKKL